LTGISVYCRSCFRFIENGPDAGPAGAARIDWVDRCGWCLEQERELQAAAIARAELWKPRRCLGPGCGVVFEPGQSKQLYHSDLCRQRAWRAARRAVSSNGARGVA
jgi:hypothetical protein